MSLIFLEGFDAYGTIARMLSSEYQAVHGSFTASTRTGRGVAWNNPWSTNVNNPPVTRRSFVAQSTLVLGFAYKSDAMPALVPGNSTLWELLRFRYDNHLGNVYTQVRFCRTQDGTLVAINGNNEKVGESNPNTLFSDVWHYIEIKWIGGTNGTITVKVDGQTCFMMSGPNIMPGQPALTNMIEFQAVTSSSSGTQTYDDMYLLNTLGSEFNDFLGDCVVHTVFPNSDAGPNDMAVFGGGLQHYMAVAESPADEDTTYLYSDTLEHTELFGIDTLPQNIIDVLAVQVSVRGKKDSAGYGNIKTLVGLDSDVLTSSLTALTGGYITRNKVFERAPDGGPWSKTKAQQMTIGFKVVE